MIRELDVGCGFFDDSLGVIMYKSSHAIQSGIPYLTPLKWIQAVAVLCMKQSA